MDLRFMIYDLRAGRSFSSGTGILPVQWRIASHSEPPNNRKVPLDRLEACPTKQVAQQL